MRRIFVTLSLVASSCALAQETTTPIKHLVVIFQENVSFDHYFATYPQAENPPGEPAFTARTDMPTPGVNGLSGGLMTRNPNAEAPFRLTRAQAYTCSQSHDYTREQQAFNSGLMDKFVEFTSVFTATCAQGLGRKLVMGYYDGNTVTAYWNYAQRFAMSDNYFETVFGPSTPGALMVVAGQTHGATVVRDVGTAANQVVEGSVIADIRAPFDDCVPTNVNTASMSGRNIGDQLTDWGITWGWFQGGFKPTSRNEDRTAACASTHANIAGISSTDYVPHHQPFQYWQSTSNPHHLPPSAVDMIGWTDAANHQYDLEDFWNAVDSGHMPAVSYLKAAAYQDGHASNSTPLDEQRFVVETINRLMQRPEWADMAIIITYDDSDGWYDHVMPPIVSQSATPMDALTGTGRCGAPAPGVYQGRCGFGPRLPLLAISPYARVNHIDHTLTNQASVVRFIEENWRIDFLGDQSFDEESGTLMNLFDFRANASRVDRLLLDAETGQQVRR